MSRKMRSRARVADAMRRVALSVPERASLAPAAALVLVAAWLFDAAPGAQRARVA